MSDNKNNTNLGTIFIIVVVLIVIYKYYKDVRKDCLNDAVKNGYTWSEAEDVCSECRDCDRR